MGALSISHWLVVLLAILLVFGPGRIKGLMGDLGSGLKSFREGMAEAPAPSKPVDHKSDEV